MCDIWKKPPGDRKEIGHELLEKLPEGLKKINIT